MKKQAEKQFRNKKYLFIALVAFWAILSVAAVIFWVIEMPKTAVIEIAVAPSNATIEIGGRRYRNGTHKIIPGDYSVKITKEGFNNFYNEFTIKEGETRKITVCLSGDASEEWLKKHPEDDKICRAAAELGSEQWKKENLVSDIYKVTPYHSYEDGFNIDAYKDDDGKDVVTITLLSCKEARREALKENAINYLKKRNVEVEKYNITYKNGCQ